MAMQIAWFALCLWKDAKTLHNHLQPYSLLLPISCSQDELQFYFPAHSSMFRSFFLPFAHLSICPPTLRITHCINLLFLESTFLTELLCFREVHMMVSMVLGLHFLLCFLWVLFASTHNGGVIAVK